jgi:hypothetical protein
MNIWAFNALLTRRLFGWNVINMAMGFVLGRNPDALWRGIGSQAVGWAAINFAIALFGGRATQKRSVKPDALKAETLAKESRNLRRLLWINAGLDVGYMLGGWWFSKREVVRPFRRGIGLGIIIQGALLLVFDVIHALQVPE